MAVEATRSVGFAHETYHLKIRIRQQSNLLSSRGQSPRYFGYPKLVLIE
ncbi:hypothetical protein [Neisseria sicca]|nr:hypothetical protein [Neisseria sicca]